VLEAEKLTFHAHPEINDCRYFVGQLSKMQMNGG
jgi:hypothetical protein